MKKLKQYTPHLTTFIVVVIFSILFAMCRNNTVKGRFFEEQLSSATGLWVEKNTAVWPGTNMNFGIATSLFKNELLFLAKEKPDAPLDLYKTWARVSNGQQLVEVGKLYNLTASSAGDDYQIKTNWPFVVVATRVIGQVRSLTIFDFESDSTAAATENWTQMERLLLKGTNFQRTGEFKGVKRTNIRFSHHPPDDVEISFEKKSNGQFLKLGWQSADNIKKTAVIDLKTYTSGSDCLAIMPEVKLPKKPILWLVDTVRAIPWIGPGPIEWAEGRVFALKDKFKRFSYDTFGDAEQFEETPAQVVEKAFTLPSGLEVGSEEMTVDWPPKTLDLPVFKRRKKGEGTWEAAGPDFVTKLDDAPPAFYKTYIRSDIRRPYVRVFLIAMDMRQLDLNMVGGCEDPQSSTGSTGTGQLPRDNQVLSKVVAAFNGAFKSEHGSYGMMESGNILLPPVDEAATIATFKDNRVALGTWPKGAPIPENMHSYRQNLDPLLENGVVNPKKRYLWGYTLGSDFSKMNTIRSGVCLRKDGTLIYAWGEDLTGNSLGVAMDAAGCEYGIHMDMNPYHTAYLFYRFEPYENNGKQPKFKSKLEFPSMLYSAYRYINGAPKDFFYLTTKSSSPGELWQAKGITQPAPAFVPAIFEYKGIEAMGLALDLSRAEGKLVPGQIPQMFSPSPNQEQDENEEKLLVEVDLGPWSAARGQIVNGAVVAGLEDGKATLIVDNNKPQLTSWPRDKSIDNATQGEWLLVENKVRQGNGSVVAMGQAGKWLYLVEGQWRTVAELMSKQGVANAIAFKIDPTSNAPVLVRKKDGMSTLGGRLIATQNTQSARLRLYGVVKDFGGTRLEKLMPSQLSQKIASLPEDSSGLSLNKTH